jgi:hypothetical protein
MNKAELKALITRELTAAAQAQIREALEMRIKAARMLTEANALLEAATKRIDCDTNGQHEFQTVPGTGMMGDRFEEKCIHCGWVHTC